MKISDVFLELGLGSQVCCYSPSLAAALSRLGEGGNPAAQAILVSHILYLNVSTGAAPDAWVRVPDGGAMAATALGRRQVRDARDSLLALGLIERSGPDLKPVTRVNLSAIRSLLELVTESVEPRGIARSHRAASRGPTARHRADNRAASRDDSKKQAVKSSAPRQDASLKSEPQIRDYLAGVSPALHPSAIDVAVERDREAHARGVDESHRCLAYALKIASDESPAAAASDERRIRVSEERAQIEACEVCDPNGWIEMPDGAVVKCEHEVAVPA